ncbi:MAG: type II toxin-antitoxin system VapC family toxin [Acetobacteraceae bacterium]
MRITPDTHVLIRAAVPAVDSMSEDGIQSAQAREILRNPTLIAVTMPALCEFVWVLRRMSKYSRHEIRAAIEQLCAATSVTCDRQALGAGLAVLAHGGDFADGVIASSGAALGGDTFVSFDRQAVRLWVKPGCRMCDRSANRHSPAGRTTTTKPDCIPAPPPLRCPHGRLPRARV